MSDCKHEWTTIAPEYDADSTFDPDTALIWSWCIRCGALDLGGHTYTPGPHQTLTLVENDKDEQRIQAKGS